MEKEISKTDAFFKRSSLTRHSLQKGKEEVNKTGDTSQQHREDGRG